MAELPTMWAASRHRGSSASTHRHRNLDFRIRVSASIAHRFASRCSDMESTSSRIATPNPTLRRDDKREQGECEPGEVISGRASRRWDDFSGYAALEAKK